MQNIHLTALWPTVILVALAAVTDLRTHRIPNWLVLPFLIAGLALGSAHGWPGLRQSLEGVLVATLLPGIFCYLGGLGMGDVKLCAAVGAWIGPSQLLLALLMTGLSGGVMAVCWALSDGYLREAFRGVASLVSGFVRNGIRPHETLVLSNPAAKRMPYAPAIAIGTLLSFLGTH